MHEMSKAIEETIINRHAFLFIFRLKDAPAAGDAGRAQGRRVPIGQTCGFTDVTRHIYPLPLSPNLRINTQ